MRTTDGAVDITDAIAILGQLFLGRDMICGDASDTDDSSYIDITDAVYPLSHLFLGGPQPPYPYPQAGGDTTWDQEAGVPRVPRQGQGGDLGCAYESFNGKEFYPCPPDNDQTQCPALLRQNLDIQPGRTGKSEALLRH